MRVLHLLGNTEDTGGILSVVRSLQTATAGVCRHVVWVNQSFVEKRKPELEFRLSPTATDEEASHGRLLLQAFRSFRGLRTLLRQESFDVVHGHTRGSFPLILLLAATGRPPCVFTSHTYANRTGMYRWASRWNRVRWVFLTPAMARHYGVEANPPRVELISACCSDGFFNNPLRASNRLPPDRPIRLIGLGNLVAWKRWDIFADALLRLDPAVRERIQFTVFGPTTSDAPAQAYAAELRRRIQEDGLSGQFILAGPTSNVAAVLAEADGYVVLSRNEPCSVSLMEALAGGIPAIVSDSGGNVDIVQPGLSGLHFRTDDVGDLAEKLNRLVRGDVQFGSPSQIRESVRSRSASSVSRQYLQLYRNAMARPPA